MSDVPLRVAVEALLAALAPAVTMEMKLDFLERLAWLLADDGAELFDVRRAWLASENEELVELALMPWSVLLANDRREAEDLLAPLIGRSKYQGCIEERLAEVENPG